MLACPAQTSARRIYLRNWWKFLNKFTRGRFPYPQSIVNWKQCKILSITGKWWSTRGIYFHFHVFSSSAFYDSSRVEIFNGDKLNCACVCSVYCLYDEYIVEDLPPALFNIINCGISTYNLYIKTVYFWSHEQYYDIVTVV